MNLPKTITAKLYIALTNHNFLTVTTGDMAEYGYTNLHVTEVTLDVPQGVNVNALQISTLEAEKKKVKAGAQVKIEQIEDKIQSLLSIEG